MNIACISDTHTFHSQVTHFIKHNNIDILIHAGDGSNFKEPVKNADQLRDCLTWMSSFVDIKYKIYVPGNHDTSLAAGIVKMKEFMDIDILIDSSIGINTGIELENSTYKGSEKIINIHGSPFTPTFGNGWAYNCDRGTIGRKHWDKIPNDTHILVTHGPPLGILDSTNSGYSNDVNNVGCRALMNKVLEIEPTYHIFGHLHDEKDIYNHGTRTIGDKCKTIFVNPSIVDLKYSKFNNPILLTI